MKKGMMVLLLIFLVGCVAVEEETSLDVPAQDVEDPLVVDEHDFEGDLLEDADEELIERHGEDVKERSGKCSEPVVFDYPPVNLDQIGWIVPLGLMSGDHVTPVDHQYYQAAHDDQIEVIMPGDGVVTRIERMGSVEEQREDWRLIIRHTCSIESVYIHIGKLASVLDAEKPTTRRDTQVSIPVKGGDVIGWYINNVDYNVIDQDVTIGLLNLESFSVAEDWKPHVQDPFLYFNDEIRERMVSLSQRSEEPYGGKIDYGVDGTLIGMWFEEGTNGYAGVDFPSSSYHQGHLAIAPNHIDPSFIMVSVGTYEGGTEGYQFGVGNVDAVVTSADWTLHDFYFELDGKIQHNWGVPKGAKAKIGATRGSVSFEIVGDKLKADFGDGVRYYVR
jgi:hypothetical protein